MANIDPVDILTALDVKLLQVDDSTSGNTLIHSTGAAPLAGQIKDFNGVEWEAVFREIENGGGMDYEAFRKLGVGEVSFVSTRFSGDWWAMHLKKCQYRASASLEDLLPIGATGYVHEVVGRVKKISDPMSNSSESEVTVTLGMIETYEVLEDGKRKWYFDRAGLKLEIGGTDIFADRRTALGLT